MTPQETTPFLLSDEEISKIAWNNPDATSDYAFENGARWARDRYEKEIARLREALEFYADEKKYFMREGTVNLKQTTAVLHVEEPESLPEDFKTKSYEVTARLKVDQGKTAREALRRVKG